MPRSNAGLLVGDFCGSCVLTASALVLVLAAGCGSRPGDLRDLTASVSGLAGSGLVLQVNGAPEVAVTRDGPVTLATIPSGTVYAVAVKTHPTNPTQTCAVKNGSGTVRATDVSDIEVSCVTTYGVGGEVRGLLGTGLILQSSCEDDAGGLPEELPVAGNGWFSFPTRHPAGTRYQVVVAQQPSAPVQTCTVEQGASGEMGDADVRNVGVICSGQAVAVGGAVSGLSGTVVLTNNDTDSLTVTANGNVTFGTMVAAGSRYSVKVKAQPTDSNQICIVSNGSGTAGATGVTDVNVTCRDCRTEGFAGGVLACNGDCSGVDTSQCTNTVIGLIVVSEQRFLETADPSVGTVLAGAHAAFYLSETAERDQQALGTCELGMSLITLRLMQHRSTRTIGGTSVRLQGQTGNEDLFLGNGNLYSLYGGWDYTLSPGRRFTDRVFSASWEGDSSSGGMLAGNYPNALRMGEPMDSTTPSWEAAQTLSGNADLRVSWNGAGQMPGDGNDVTIQFLIGDGSVSTGFYCRVADTGEFSVPAAMMAQLSKGSGSIRITRTQRRSVYVEAEHSIIWMIGQSEDYISAKKP